MVSPSFQTLPMLIVEMVVEYLEERTRTSLDGSIDRHNSKKLILTPLLWVSESWRVAALSSICDNCSLVFNNSAKGYDVIYPAWPANFSLPHFNRDKLAKRIVILAPSWNKICSGAFSSTFTGPIYECAMFPTATSLMVFLSEDDDPRPIKNACDKSSASSLASTVRDAAVASFARSLLQLAPTATGISMYFCTAGVTIQQNKGLCNVLVSELCTGSVSRVEIDSAPGCSLPSLQLHGSPGLTSLIQGLGQVCAPFARIAYLNANTLKELAIRPTSKTEWHTSIYGDTKTPAVYTSLTSLILPIDGVPRSVKWAEIKDAVPFPALIKLSIYGVYPFDDNLLYRGNGRSLKALRIPFGAVARNILGKYRMLSRSDITRMNMVDLDFITDADNMLVTGRGNTVIKHQMDRMLEVTMQLSLANDTPDLQLFNAIKTAPRTAILQHLMLCNVPLDTDKIIEVISALPTLVSLSCELKRSVPSAKALPLNNQPNVLHGKHYPLSSNFRRLMIMTDNDVSAKKIASVSMQIAVICPKFVHVDISIEMRKVFRREIAWAMVNQPFKPYADSLRRLI
ncbi:hypothetical protein GGH94_004515 [Coemansia aciculifera]|uniref:Uncharacterized protein n=1 Tax=Coemansia aciculifera TaxID=417176 RepID=A0A9W8ILQ1_9FUNG|nr:hypothetical protein GGH94_004515 [Coemansia aciculifera]